MAKHIAIIGAGYTGLAAAYELVSSGHSVTIFEKDSDVGGLAGTFELQEGIRLEKFYHHWFSSDTAVISLIERLGLGSKIRRLTSNTGLYYANSIFRLASPKDLLSFTPIPLVDRIRTGLMALWCRRISDYRTLEDISAADWIIRHGGRKAFDVIWHPLLQGKFGDAWKDVSAVWFWNKLKLRGSSRDAAGNEQLLYFEGGFGALTEALRTTLEAKGVVFKLCEPISEILVEHGRATGVRSSAGTYLADAVLATTPIPEFFPLCPSLPPSYVEKYSKIRFLGNVCFILRLKRSLSDTYWLNVADPSFPFVGVIEHTNFDSPEQYGGEHLAYLSKYLPTSDPLFHKTPAEFFEYCIPFLQKMFPAFDREWVLGYHLWKAHYSQPITTKRYSEIIPPFDTPIPGLFLCTMAQIYPEDRGTNYAALYGNKVATHIQKALNEL